MNLGRNAHAQEPNRATKGRVWQVETIQICLALALAYPHVDRIAPDRGPRQSQVDAAQTTIAAWNLISAAKALFAHPGGVDTPVVRRSAVLVAPGTSVLIGPPVVGSVGTATAAGRNGYPANEGK